MSKRKWYAIGIFLVALVIGTLMRALLPRDLLVDLASAALVLAGLVVAVIVYREPAK